MATNFVAESWAYLAIDLVVVFGRAVARWKSVGLRGLAVDDYLMVVAILLYTAETATAHYVGAYWFGLANSAMTDDERASLDPHSLEWHLRTKGSQTQLFGWLVYTVLLWVLKFCWLFFYKRLGEGVNRMALKINIGFIFCAVTFCATFLTILLKCQPISKNWQIYPDPGNWCQPAVSKLQAYVLISNNLATDFYIMSIPLPMIWSARIGLVKKLALIAMFCGGLVTAIAGILRCTFVLLDRPDGPQLAGEWSCRESFIAVFISNIPVMYPIVHKFINHVRQTVYTYSYSRSRTGMKSGGDGNGTGTGMQGSKGYKLSSVSMKGRKKEKFKHPLSLPGDTFYERFGSEEEIIGIDGKIMTHTSGEKTSSREDEKHVANGIQMTREWEVASSKDLNEHPPEGYHAHPA